MSSGIVPIPGFHLSNTAHSGLMNDRFLSPFTVWLCFHNAAYVILLQLHDRNKSQAPTQTHSQINWHGIQPPVSFSTETQLPCMHLDLHKVGWSRCTDDNFLCTLVSHSKLMKILWQGGKTLSLTYAAAKQPLSRSYAHVRRLINIWAHLNWQKHRNFLCRCRYFWWIPKWVIQTTHKSEKSLCVCLFEPASNCRESLQTVEWNCESLPVVDTLPCRWSFCCLTSLHRANRQFHHGDQ